MEELIAVLSTVPYGVEIMIGLGTGTALMSVVSPVVSGLVKMTAWKWDDRALEWMRTNPVMKKLGWVGRQLKRFSLV